MLTSSTTPSSSRIVELDSLRALAAINLMLFHFTHVYATKYGYTNELGFEFPWGKYGVQLFFMLSGFVNAMTLLKKGQPTQFLANRFIRILPVFYVVVAINVLLMNLAPFHRAGGMDWQMVMANLTLMPNLLGFECLEPVTWTLQVEVLFYGILTAMYCFGAFKRPLISLMMYLAVCLMGGLLIEPMDGNATTSWMSIVRELLLLEYMPLLIIGMLLQQIRFGTDSKWPKLAGILASAIVFHVIDRHDHNPVITILLTGLLAGAAFGKLPVLRIKPLVFISTISYSLYLLHDNLGCFIIYHMNQNGLPPLACFIVIIPLIILFSTISTHFLERPLSAVLRTWWKRLQENLKLQSAISPKNTSIRQARP